MINPIYGFVESTFKYPTVLVNTIFIALNTLACSVENAHLYSDFADPGDQLSWL